RYSEPGLCDGDTDHGPHQAVRENQAEVSPGARVTNAEIPAKLVAKGVADRFSRVYDIYRKPAQLDPAAAHADAIAEFIVVAEVIHERFKYADFGEVLLRGGHHRAEHEAHAAKKPCDQDSGREIGAIAQGLESGREGPLGQAAVQTGDAANCRVGKRCGHGAQEARFDAHVAVTDKDDLVACLADHAAELVDLVACAARLGANQQADPAPREISDQFPYDRDRRLLVIADTEQDFKFGIILAAEA